MTNFNTILYQVLSPKNVGMIIRSHVAFSGDKIVFVGYDQPWSFRKGTQAYSQKLEKQCEVLHFVSEREFFNWSRAENLVNIAIEIDTDSILLSELSCYRSCNLIVGGEKLGLPRAFMRQCDYVVTIPQFGPVECLNVSISASIAMYELRRKEKSKLIIKGSKYFPRTN